MDDQPSADEDPTDGTDDGSPTKPPSPDPADAPAAAETTDAAPEAAPEAAAAAVAEPAPQATASASDPAHTASGARSPQPHIQDFIFKRELAEVYLLLDNVSATLNKKMPQVAKDDPLFGGQGKTWIEQICEIGWPPEGSTEDIARKAAKLVRARDMLNQATAPATGATIAFSLLVAGEEKWVEPERRVWWRRMFLWMGGGLTQGDGETSSESDRRTARTDGDGATRHRPVERYGWASGYPSRRSLATMAFPNLPYRADIFRRNLILTVMALVIWLLGTCFLSWNVATGSALMAQLKSANDDLATVSQQIAQAGLMPAETPPAAPAASPPAGPAGKSPLPKKPGATPPGPPPPAASGGPSPGTSPGSPLPARADEPPAAPSAAPATTPLCDPAPAVAGQARAAPTPTQAALCRKAAEDRIDRTVAEDNLKSWLTNCGWLHLSLHPLCWECGSPTTSDGAVNDQWAAVLLGVLAGAVLPICYGVLGAGAAVVRSLSAKMRESMLAPRDWTLSLIQLALGAIIGVCVGLFVTPDGDTAPTSGGLIQSVHLSASALSFIAGFGVEGVFVALSSLVNRVFNLDDPAGK